MIAISYHFTYGGLAQSEECVVCNDEAAGSKPAFSMDWSYSVMVITVDFESTNPGSNPGRTFFWDDVRILFHTFF